MNIFYNQQAQDLIKRLSGRFFKNQPEDSFIELPRLESDGTAHKGFLQISSGKIFTHFFISRHKDTLVGINEETNEIIKVEINRYPGKKLDIVGESEIMRYLERQNCASSPSVIEAGHLDVKEVIKSLPKFSIECKNTTANYFVQHYLPPGGKIRFADLVFSLLEQKALGIYQADVKPTHVRINPQNGVCVLIDYDQAVVLDEKTRSLNCAEFLLWSDQFEQKKNGVSSWRSYFPSLKPNHVKDLIKDGALDLAMTTLYKNQRTTNNDLNIYHSIFERDVVAKGTRDIGDRQHLLDQINFSKNEKVLDIGCNAGLLCHYLFDRECHVTGMDMDSEIITAAGMISRISGRQIRFFNADLDVNNLQEQYDTIMLFSVLHHAKDINGMARKITQSCNRIIIETRPFESGKKPIDGKWEKSSGWQLDNLDELIRFLCGLFEGFELIKNHGIGGKGRYILELQQSKNRNSVGG